jgi:hypothetical protein
MYGRSRRLPRGFDDDGGDDGGDDDDDDDVDVDVTPGEFTNSYRFREPIRGYG